ncbi:MAG: DNA methylase N-4, partial [Alphaproteobacteria bacterium]|nr:DNA methylase N-4 [Alphaproteobacteria bacterium]
MATFGKLGHTELFCGNSLEETTFNQLMEGTVADTVLQDPPYNVKINGHVCGSGAIHHKEFAMASGEMSVVEFINFLKQNLFLCKAHSKDGA